MTSILWFFFRAFGFGSQTQTPAAAARLPARHNVAVLPARCNVVSFNARSNTAVFPARGGA